MIEAKLIGIDKLEADLQRRLTGLVASVDAFVADVARDGAQRIRDAMLSSASPSSPGSAPGVVTGNLIKSVRAVHEAGTLMAEVRMGSSGKRGKAPHWHLLEFGTSKMAARPVIRPQAKAAVIAGEARLGQAIGKA